MEKKQMYEISCRRFLRDCLLSVPERRSVAIKTLNRIVDRIRECNSDDMIAVDFSQEALSLLINATNGELSWKDGRLDYTDRFIEFLKGINEDSLPEEIEKQYMNEIKRIAMVSDDVRLVGLIGKAGSGKDTLADEIAVDGWEKVAFADSLKHMCIDYLGLSYEDAYTQEGKMKFNETWGMTNRAILQKVGTEAMRNGFDKDVWVKILGIRIRKMLAEGRKVVVTDCRFDNECQMIEDMGGIVVEVVRDSQSQNLSATEQKHASEQPVSRKFVAFTIDNNGDKSELRGLFNKELR